MRYYVDERPTEGVAIINGQIWNRVKARKGNSCAISRRPIQPGDMVYRPQTNGDNRMHRILAAVVERHPIA